MFSGLLYLLGWSTAPRAGLEPVGSVAMDGPASPLDAPRWDATPPSRESALVAAPPDISTVWDPTEYGEGGDDVKPARSR